MPKFMLDARVTFSSLLEVDGDDEEDAINKAYEQYPPEKLIPDPEALRQGTASGEVTFDVSDEIPEEYLAALDNT